MWVESLWGPLEASKSPLSSANKGVRVAAYARVSPGVKEDSKSLENQVHYFTLKIRRNPNWKFVGVYLDDEISGLRYDNRHGLKRLLRHAEEGKIDAVLIKNISRLSRNFKETLELVEKFKSFGVILYFEKEKINTSQENTTLALKVYASMAQEESISTSIAADWAYQKKFMRGEPKYSKIFGYDFIKTDGKGGLIINEEEAEIVKEIYRMHLSGMKWAESARQLVARGIKTPSGKDMWTGSTIKNILTNITYTGSKLTRVKKRDPISNHINEGERNQFLIENCHPAIISKEVYEKAQRMIKHKKRRIKPYKKKRLRALSDRMYCGRCGKKILVQEGANEDRWRCTAAGYKLCDFKSIPERKIKEMMLGAYDSRYDLNSNHLIKTLKNIITQINENDHFEFHRLKYLADIEILRQSDQAETQLEELLLIYKTFEEKVVKIEDDRGYRNLALDFLNSVKMDRELIEKIEVDHMRALISGLKIYSEDDYIIIWFDEKETVFGDCKRYGKPKLLTEGIELYEPKVSGFKVEGPVTLEQKKSNQDNDKENKRIDLPVIQKTKGEDYLGSNSTMEVIPVEAGRAAITMRNIYQGLGQFNTCKVSNSKGKNKKKLSVAAYCRVSTELEEQQVSLKTQIAYYTYLILKNPEYEFAGIYVDNGISAKEMTRRPELLILLDECRKGKVDLILTKSISRFSRNVVDTLETVNELRNLASPTYIFFEKENIMTDSIDSTFLLSLHSVIAEEDIRTTSESVTWGKKRLAERGIVPVHCNYGYIKEKGGKWTVNEKEAQIIRRIYQEVLDGKTKFKIVQDLGIDGVKSPEGNDYWNYKTLNPMLSNVVYKGAYLYQKTYTKNVLEGRSVKNTGEMPQYYIENHHPAIIDPVTWDAVQEVLSNSKNYSTLKHSDTHLDTEKKNESLQDIYLCGECGSKIGHRKYSERRYKGVRFTHKWGCVAKNNFYKVDKCDLLNLKQEYLEWHLLKTLLDMKENLVCEKKFKSTLENLELSEKELKEASDMQNELEGWNERLYQAVDTQVNIKGQDATYINEITEVILELKSKLKEYENRQEDIINYQIKWENLKKDLLGVNNKRYKNFEKNRDATTLELLGEIIKSYNIKGEIFQNGVIKYYFNFGFCWTIKMCYNDYQDRVKEEKIKVSQAKYEKLLYTKEVDELIEFCKRPRKFMEMYEFMIAMQDMSETYFRVRYILPLIEKGRIDRKIRGKTSSNNQRYFAVVQDDK